MAVYNKGAYMENCSSCLFFFFLVVAQYSFPSTGMHPLMRNIRTDHCAQQSPPRAGSRARHTSLLPRASVAPS